MRRFTYHVPETLADAAQACAKPGHAAKAGGIDLLDRMKEGIDRPAQVVGLHRALPAGVHEDARGLRVGCGLTLAELARDATVQEHAPSLARSAGEAATPNVREMATLGGNLMQLPRCLYLRSRHYDCHAKSGNEQCWAKDGAHDTHALFGNEACSVVHPSNLAPALLSLDARAEVEGPEGGRSLPLADALAGGATGLRPGELLAVLHVPAERLGPRAAHYEVRAKQSYDWPLTIAAANFNGPSPTLVLGAVAAQPRPVEAADLLATIRDRGPSAERLEQLADRATAGATPLPNNAWRLPILRATVKRAVLQALQIPEEQW